MRFRSFIAVLLVVGALTVPATAQDFSKQLLQSPTIAGAVTAVVGDVLFLPPNSTMRTLAVQAKFTYGSGGTTAKAWVQTSFDGGTTWCDIMSFAFTTASATKVSAIKTDIAVAAAYVPTDATLADDTIKDGLLGDRVRVKYTTTGTYGGATSLRITGVIR